MEDPKQRLTKCVSTAELERRWNLVREQMRQRKIDYLVIQNSEEFMGGTLRWFTDFTARHQFPMTAIFPVDDEMTTIVCGVDPPGENWPPAWAARGIKNRWGACYFSTIHYTNEYDAELAAKVLGEKKKPTIGLVERGFIPITFYEGLVKRLPDATFVDATDWIDELRVIKSAEEIELIRGTAAMQDACAWELKNIIKPGKRDMEVYAEIHRFLSSHGSERGLVQVGSGPLGTFVPFDIPHFQNRVIKYGDQVTVLIEVNGSGGYYTEILRVFVIGKQPTQLLQDAFGAAAEFEAITAKNLVTGADPKDFWIAYRDFIAKRGYTSPGRSFAHGQGLSLVDRPNLRPDEPWKIKAGMNIAVHPYAIGKDVFAICGNNYLTTESGAERLHLYPSEITVL